MTASEETMVPRPACRGGPTALARLFGLVRTVHPFPVAVVVVTAVLLLAATARHLPSAPTLMRAGGVVLLSQLAVGALNDWYDRAIDAQVQPRKPIPSGLVSPGAALTLAILSLIALMPLALTFGPLAFGLALLGTGAGLAYDVWLKPTPFSVLGYIVGFLALVSWVLTVAGRFAPPLLLAYPGAAFLLTAAHLAQSLPDVETDRQAGGRGLAAVLGVSGSIRVIFALVGIVVAGGVVLGMLASSAPALLMASGGLILAAVAGLVWSRGNGDVVFRHRLFYVLAPAVGLVGLSCLVSLVQLSS